jgi:hypothetical protein
MTTDLLEQPVLDSRPLIRYHDRCDARNCGAEGMVLVTLGDLELIFCGHHGREKAILLMSQGFTVDDQSDRILANDNANVSL